MENRSVHTVDGESAAVPTVDELQRLIDPEVWGARYEDQRNLG